MSPNRSDHGEFVAHQSEPRRRRPPLRPPGDRARARALTHRQRRPLGELHLGLPRRYDPTLVPSTFTGANIALAFALTFALCVPHFVTYGWLSSAMPRSGGDYLFLSRVVHPLAGFIVNGIISLVFIAGLGNVALTVPQFGLPAMFESLAFITGSPSLGHLHVRRDVAGGPGCGSRAR